MLTAPKHSKLHLWLELLVVFAVLPLVCWRAKLPVMAVLLLASLLVSLWLIQDGAFDRSCLRFFPADGVVWRKLMLVWIGAIPLLAGLAWLMRPEALFDLPTRHTKLWLVVMVAYPVISVVPQEIIYRAFFCHRYRPLFGHGARMVLANAAAFALAHIVFGNPIAVLLTFAGGWLFARTFLATKSLPCVAVLHALYGAAIFTVGLGHYFFQGTEKSMETF